MNFPFSEALVETILEDSHSILGVYDLASKSFVYLNKVALNKLKVADVQEYTLKYPAGFRKIPITEEKYNEIENKLKGQHLLTEEVIFKMWNGEEFWGLLQMSSFVHDFKTFYFVRITDITAQKINEQAIKDEENRFEALFMHSAIGIIMVNKESKIILSNRYADALFGYESGELTGQQLDILIPRNVSASHQKTFENFTHKPQARAMGIGLDLNGRRKDETLFPIEISLSHFKSDGTPYYISFINDISLKKKTEIDLISKKNEIEKLNESLEREVISRTNALVETLKRLEVKKLELEFALNKEKELGELKSRFVAMASHEFRTPLTAIQSAASLIEKYQSAEDQDKRERHTHRIKNAVGNLTDILEEFLSVGKLEEGKVELKNTLFDIKELVQDCLTDLTSIMKKGQTVNFENNGATEICLDKSLLRKIISNLTSNAFKFSPENSEINIATEITKTSFLLSVTDTGIGIAEEDQKHLFDRFFRGKNVTNIQGTGLGLHIVARYAELLGGKVSVKSKLNEGTTFLVKIKL